MVSIDIGGLTNSQGSFGPPSPAPGESAIADIALQIRQTLDLATICQTTVDAVQRLLGCDRALLYQFDADKSGEVVVEAVTDPRWSILGRIVHDPCFEADWLKPYDERQARAIADVATANLSPCHAEFLAGFQIRANLVVPVLCESQLWGLLIAHSCTAPRPWQPDEITTLQQLAIQVGIALQQAELVAQLQAAKANLEAEVAARTAALRASEARWQFALEGAGDGVWDWNSQTNTVFFSRQWKAMLGYSDAEISNSLEEWSSRVHPNDLDQCYADLQRHFRGETLTYQNEHRVRCKDGSYKWILDRGKVIEWVEPGVPLRVIGTHSDISDRKQMELALQATNQELDQFFSVALDLLCIADTNGHFRRLNQQWQKTLGYSLVELEGAQFFDYVHPDDLPATLEAVNRLASQQAVSQFVNRYRCQDGTYRWFEWRSAPAGNLIYAAARDITLRKQTELELKQAKEQLDLVLQASSEGFSDWNFLTNEVYFSPQFKTILGYAEPEFEHPLAMWKSAIFDEDKAIAWQLLEAYNNGTIDRFSMTQRYRHKNGSTVYILTNLIHLKDAEGQVVRVVGSHLDITPLVTIQESLKISEMQLASVLDSSLDGIMAFRSVRDEQGHIVDFEWLLSNPAACELVGRIEADLVGKRLLEEMPGNREEGLFDGYVHTVETGESYQREFHYNHDGIESWFENIAVKLGDGFAVTFRNVTAKKQAEQQLHQLNQQLGDRVVDLAQRHIEMVVLSEISDFLQACSTVEEACSTITNLVESLFPGCAGGLSILRESGNRLQLVSHWGSQLSSTPDFEPLHCWGLRRGRMHYVGQDRLSLRCQHIRADQATAILCVPMMAQGRTLGLLHLSTDTPTGLSEPQQQLARTLAEQVGMAIANLKLQATLRHQSIRDPLTGLYNRRYLEEALSQELLRAQRKHHGIGVIMIDIDHFKRFNDTFGHDAGDVVLQQVATLVQQNVRNSDIVCRYGGEEMILVLPEVTLAETIARAERLWAAIGDLAPHHHGQNLGSLSASFGVAVFPDHGSTASTLIKAADGALYQAKAAGRNQVLAATTAFEAE
ncbi:diguanylate cyclase [Nodosilinea sp. PGN35]|uniref:diguanylate cyclase n=1 Tax=Nodosilinea sp. PGN35 TaxID=3020489 RepID=UPI0023B30717|nr:diguanylate cyclase [Nodosilinea sp. TSF1-S3]MDF0369730.1 diguanylate cyclase [Nodosilinea sp. TSF1-S3]